MDEYVKLSCISILDEIEKHPISEMFAHPVDPIADEAPNYLTIIKSPMDFSTIRNKLHNNQYLTIQNFKNDVQLVFTNATTYNGKSSPVGVIAFELSQLFKDLSKNLADDSDTCWYNKLVNLKKELINHVQQHPLNASKAKQEQTITFEGEDEASAVIGKFDVNFMNSSSLEHLSKNLVKLVSPKQIEQLHRIIEEENPEIDTSSAVDLNILTPEALRKLKEYTISELEMERLDYE